MQRQKKDIVNQAEFVRLDVNDNSLLVASNASNQALLQQLQEVYAGGRDPGDGISWLKKLLVQEIEHFEQDARNFSEITLHHGYCSKFLLKFAIKNKCSRGEGEAYILRVHNSKKIFVGYQFALDESDSKNDQSVVFFAEDREFCAENLATALRVLSLETYDPTFSRFTIALSRYLLEQYSSQAIAMVFTNLEKKIKIKRLDVTPELIRVLINKYLIKIDCSDKVRQKILNKLSMLCEQNYFFKHPELLEQLERLADYYFVCGYPQRAYFLISSAKYNLSTNYFLNHYQLKLKKYLLASLQDLLGQASYEWQQIDLTCLVDITRLLDCYYKYLTEFEHIEIQNEIDGLVKNNIETSLEKYLLLPDSHQIEHIFQQYADLCAAYSWHESLLFLAELYFQSIHPELVKQGFNICQQIAKAEHLPSEVRAKACYLVSNQLFLAPLESDPFKHLNKEEWVERSLQLNPEGIDAQGLERIYQHEIERLRLEEAKKEKEVEEEIIEVIEKIEIGEEKDSNLEINFFASENTFDQCIVQLIKKALKKIKDKNELAKKIDFYAYLASKFRLKNSLYLLFAFYQREEQFELSLAQLAILRACPISLKEQDYLDVLACSLSLENIDLPKTDDNNLEGGEGFTKSQIVHDRFYGDIDHLIPLLLSHIKIEEMNQWIEQYVAADELKFFNRVYCEYLISHQKQIVSLQMKLAPDASALQIKDKMANHVIPHLETYIANQQWKIHWLGKLRRFFIQAAYEQDKPTQVANMFAVCKSKPPAIGSDRKRYKQIKKYALNSNGFFARLTRDEKTQRFYELFKQNKCS